VFSQGKLHGHSLFTQCERAATLGGVFQLGFGRMPLRLLVLACVLLAEVVSARAAPSPERSPRPERVAPRDAWRIAEEFAAQNKTCDVVVGSGGSMLPLYPDRTVLLIQRLPMSELRYGMTVIFIGDSGRPVAHTLVEKTARGWRAQGLANAKRDETLVRERNYLGTVIRAFTPVLGLPADEHHGTGAPSSGALGGG
jgi:hypothetical protein